MGDVSPGPRSMDVMVPGDPELGMPGFPRGAEPSEGVDLDSHGLGQLAKRDHQR
jgi:hypothetical protein